MNLKSSFCIKWFSKSLHDEIIQDCKRSVSSLKIVWNEPCDSSDDPDGRYTCVALLPSAASARTRNPILRFSWIRAEQALLVRPREPEISFYVLYYVIWKRGHYSNFNASMPGLILLFCPQDTYSYPSISGFNACNHINMKVLPFESAQLFVKTLHHLFSSQSKIDNSGVVCPKKNISQSRPAKRS